MKDYPAEIFIYSTNSRREGWEGDRFRGPLSVSAKHGSSGFRPTKPNATIPRGADSGGAQFSPRCC